MPQLDTSTWFITILSMLFTLFILFQNKINTYNFTSPMQLETLTTFMPKTPWEKKWTKTYLPLSLPLP